MPKAQNLSVAFACVCATVALRAHAKHLQQTYRAEEGSFTQLLTNMRHLAQRCGVDFNKALDASYQHYLEEKA